MADVFISYKQSDRTRVETVASRLRLLELSVWFDARMSAGESFNDEIDREARLAKAVLVCWSPDARESRWVKAEAMIGFERDNLTACYVSGPDGFSPPTPFNTAHAEDLRAWLVDPSDSHSAWKSVLRRLGRLCERPDIESWAALDNQPRVAELRSWLDAYPSSPLFLTVDAQLKEREDEESMRARIEAEARERRARESAERARSEELARKKEAEDRAREYAEHQLQAQLAEARDRAEAVRSELAKSSASWRPLGASIGCLVWIASALGLIFVSTLLPDQAAIVVMQLSPLVGFIIAILVLLWVRAVVRKGLKRIADEKIDAIHRSAGARA